MPVTAEVESTLAVGRQAHVAVSSPRGPHVTPELYAWSDGRLWFWFATSTLKSRVLAERPEAAALVSAEGRSVLLQGRVDVVDVRRPATLLSGPRRGLRISRGLGAYLLRNAAD